MEFTTEFTYAYGGPVCSAQFRTRNEDFIVDEELGWRPEGEGEHLYLDVSKAGENTPWVAQRLAKFVGVKETDIGYCGMKDRHAITRQWFSVYFPKGELPDWSQFAKVENLNVHIHEVLRGNRKLRRGQHQYNQFKITLRDVQLSSQDSLNELLQKIANQGVPNYFGEQRFGREGNNLQLASAWFDRHEKVVKRHNKHLVMSAARSYLFNKVLELRIQHNNWQNIVDGDPLIDEMPTGPLWGRGRSAAQSLALDLEQQALESFSAWCDGLEHVGLQQERRPLILKAEHMNWALSEGNLVLEFRLPPGQYATSLLREIAILASPDRTPKV